MDFVTSHFGKMSLSPVEHFYNIFVLTFGRDCYCIQLVRGSSFRNDLLQNPYFKLSFEVLAFTVIFAKIFWFWFWSTIAKIFLKLVGFAGIGLIFGRGYAFVNLTIFRWTDEIGIDLKTLAYGTAALTLVNIKELLKELMVEYQELIIELREARN